MSNVVCDTSSLITFHKGNVLFCLERLFDKIIVPHAVSQESLDPEVSEFLKKPCCEIREVNQTLFSSLGEGEREAVSLAAELGIKTIITDDKKAINKAKQHNLKPVQTLDILLLAKFTGLITEIKPVMDRITEKGDGIQPERYRKALEIAGEA